MIKKLSNLILLFIITSCGTLNEAGGNTKGSFFLTKNSSEVVTFSFLKTLPDYDKVPLPGSIKNKKLSEDQKIKSILNAPQKSEINESDSSMENSIIEKIRK